MRRATHAAALAGALAARGQRRVIMRALLRDGALAQVPGVGLRSAFALAFGVVLLERPALTLLGCASGAALSLAALHDLGVTLLR